MAEQRTIEIPSSATFENLSDLNAYLKQAAAEHPTIMLDENELPRAVTWFGGPTTEDALQQYPQFRRWSETSRLMSSSVITTALSRYRLLGFRRSNSSQTDEEQ